MILSDLYNLYLANKISKLPPNEFFEKYSKELLQIQIGCSFNPEHWILYNAEQKDSNIKLKVAKFIIEDLQMKEIRLSIRWSEVYKNGVFSFDYYHELFQYFLKHDVNICLNIGPIKTMRWPEEQVPDYILKELRKIPKKKEVIEANSELGILSLQYLEDLLIFLKQYLTPVQLKRIKSIQGNNEAFYQFGEYKWTISPDLELKVFNLINKYFPDKDLMINSAGRSNLREVINLIKAFKTGNKIKFHIGYNYYYRLPGQRRFPFINTLDNLFHVNSFALSMGNLKKFCRELDISIEISELQGEPWEDLKSPGNSIQEFHFTLIRCMKEILNLSDERKSIIRYWGIEEFALKFIENRESEENKKIKDLIVKLNS